MNVQSQAHKTSPGATEHFDVLIAGAGISGVGAAYHLTTQCPGTTFVAFGWPTFWWLSHYARFVATLGRRVVENDRVVLFDRGIG